MIMNTHYDSNSPMPDPIDDLLRRSLTALDDSARLPSNFAYRVAMKAAEEAAARAARTRRRERLMGWIVPSVAAILVVASIVWALPTLPAMLLDSFKGEGMWIGLGGVGVALLALDYMLRRKLAAKRLRR